MNQEKLRAAAALVADLVPAMQSGVQIDLLASHGMTLLQHVTVVSVSLAGRCTMSRLAAGLKMSLPRVTQIVDRLIKLGFLKREGDPNDRRKIFVHVTPKGNRFLNDFKEVVKRRWLEALADMDEEELDSFIGLICKIMRRLKYLRENPVL